MLNNNRYKLIINSATFGLIILTLGTIAINPNLGRKSPQKAEFESEIDLSGWELTNSDSFALPKRKDESPEGIIKHRQLYGFFAGGHEYDYQKNDYELNIKTLYVLGSIGGIHQFILDENNQPLPRQKGFIELREKEGIGYYGLFKTEEKAHLIACINSTGKTTVTSKQFFLNRKEHNLQLTRMFSWLMGQESLVDRRCLWNHLSLPLNDQTPESLYPILEEAWFSWYQQWDNNFPQL
jgi:cyanosortase A-associated protein